ncbi:MAG: hypothetical protein EXR99_10635 [Gemmataceae bacterium]|nr:hypothetical protein [Gemmataceae bacterium]
MIGSELQGGTKRTEDSSGGGWLGLGECLLGWNQFWFSPARTESLGLIRMVTGILIAFITFTYSFELLSYVGPNGFVDVETINYIRQDSPILVQPASWKGLPYEVGKTVPLVSVYFHLSSPALIWTFHLGFLACTLCMAVGWQSRFFTLLSWFGALCYVQRAPSVLFGMDAMIMILLFYMALAPSGMSFSLDRWLEKRRKKAAGDPHWNAPPEKLVSANFILRLIQIHFCIIYFAAAGSKLLGSAWWNGTALWGVMANYSFNPMNIPAYTAFLTFLAQHRLLWEVTMTAGCIFTLFIESSFSFLVWNRKMKWFMIGCAVLFHTGIGLIMGLVTFSLCMLTFLIAFIPSETIASVWGEKEKALE